jgi:hypothetical protein
VVKTEFRKAVVQFARHSPQAAIITSGHGLLDVTIAVTLDEAGDVLKRGAALVDEASEYGTGLHVLRDAGAHCPRWASRRNGRAAEAGPDMA